MALITCHECQNQVSSEAKTCPSCGAKVVIPKPAKKPVSGNSIFKGVVVGFIALAVINGIGAYHQSQKSPAQIEREAAAEVAEQKLAAKKAQAAKLAEERDTKAAIVAAAVRRSSRNPERIDWESILTNETGSVVCITARLENGFGGMNRESIAAANGKFSNKSKDWNRHCANKKLINVTRVVSSMQKYMD